MSTACFSKDIDEFKFELEYMSKNYNTNGYKFFNNSEIKNEINSDTYLAGLLDTYSYHLNPLKINYWLS